MGNNSSRPRPRPQPPPQPQPPAPQNVRVLGAQTTVGSDGSLPLRREIRDLEANFPDQFNLFILAMRAIEAKSKDDPQSYYQIAGIHGMPYRAWNNATGISNFEFGGYCTHSSILFVPWHRPFLALIEQSLHATAAEIAQQFPANVRDRYVEAARTLRLPYFDWAARVTEPAPSLPNSIGRETIRVVDTDGTRKNIPNPLYSFDVAAVRPDSGDLRGRWDPSSNPRTVRHPNRGGSSQNFIIEQELDNESASLRSELSILLLSYNDFDVFSNSRWRPDGGAGTYSSLEGIHDDIHGRCGGSGGHMSALDVSAMDPIFWLHHCNVDRMWAMWQDLNPDEYMTARPAPYSTFSTRRGQIENAQSPLSPFWDSSGTRFWTSERVKSTSTFGYAYPETQSWTFPDRAAYQTFLRRSIARLYGSNPFLNFAQAIAPKDAAANRPTIAGIRKMSVRAPVGGDQKPMAMTMRTAAATGNTPKKEEADEGTPTNPIEEGDLEAPLPEALSRLAPNNEYTEWIVNVRALKHGLGTTFRVIIFLGDFSSNPEDWAGNAEYNTVGRVTVLGRNSDTQCAKCRDDREHDVMTTGTVPLTSALIQDIAAGKLGSLEPKDVISHLKRNLHWRVKTFEGVEHPRDQVPGLKVSVSSMPVTIDEYGVPSYSRVYTTHREITAGRPGGLVENDEM